MLVPRPHLPFEAQLVAGKSHELGAISCPDQPDRPSTTSGISFGKQKHDAEVTYPQRMRRLNIFPASKSEVISVQITNDSYSVVHCTLVFLVHICGSMRMLLMLP